MTTMTAAACRRHDPELFFSDLPSAKDEAKRVCLGCLLREACLTGALARNEPAGVWGGLTADERLLIATRDGMRRTTAQRHNLDTDAVLAAIAAGQPMTKVAKRFGVHQSVIRAVRDEAGDTARQVQAPRTAATDLPAEEIAAAYAAGATLHQLESRYHAAPKTIRKAIVSQGGAIRPRSIGPRPTIHGPRPVTV
ncbi:WhiB family transcriptional regulator [Mumia sp. DW29H23]|uniref:WhiB family transcriptional regulator n=1 Tax=Mumia sp. DW29H23 TaxID=3421241 RepID=UPI003D6946DC